MTQLFMTHSIYSSVSRYVFFFSHLLPTLSLERDALARPFHSQSQSTADDYYHETPSILETRLSADSLRGWMSDATLFP